MWSKTEKSRKGEGQWPLHRNRRPSTGPSPAPSMDKRCGSTPRRRGEVRPARCGRHGPALTSSPAMSGSAQPEKEAVPRGTAPHLAVKVDDPSLPVLGCPLRHGDEQPGQFSDLAPPPANNNSAGPPRSNPGRPLALPRRPRSGGGQLKDRAESRRRHCPTSQCASMRSAAHS